ncbi:hypothetical protein [Methylobacterium sp. CM6257]|jgi:hypothetical protein
MNKLVRLVAAFALTGAAATAASAVSMTPEQKAVLQQQCAGDFTAVCADLPPEDSPEVQACFEKNMSKLSPGCQAAIKSYKQGRKG